MDDIDDVLSEAPFVDDTVQVASRWPRLVGDEAVFVGLQSWR
jgi:hypothetical protein